MKLIVLHGDDTPKRYKRLLSFLDAAKSRGLKIQRVNDNSIDLRELFVSDTLFNEKRLIIVEDYRLFDKKMIGWLKDNHTDLDLSLVIYHKATLNKTFLKSLPKIDKEEEFKLPQLLWSFLESFYPGNSKIVLQVLHKILDKEPVEFVFSLLSKQLRDVYWAKNDPSTLPYPPWRIGKLKSHASKFTNKQLEQILDSFAKADIKSKTSQAELIDELDFIIATKLE